jgi:hypothetical protein
VRGAVKGFHAVVGGLQSLMIEGKMQFFHQLLGRLQMLDIGKAILKRSENRGIQLQQEFWGDF